jgi:hypothetical protein
MSESTTKTSIRMARCGFDRTLDGYVFSDLAHARLWLSQSFVVATGVVLDEVEIGPLLRCKRCDGSGFHQTTRSIRPLTVREVLDQQ